VEEFNSMTKRRRYAAAVTWVRAQKRLIEMGKRLKAKAAARGAPVEEFSYTRWMEAAGGQCSLCGAAIVSPSILVMRERVPDLGHTWDNVVAAHRRCLQAQKEEDRAMLRETRRHVMRLNHGRYIRKAANKLAKTELATKKAEDLTIEDMIQIAVETQARLDREAKTE
jgi:hypothetical protein